MLNVAMHNMEKFAALVTARRIELDLTQEQVGEVFGVSKSSISDIESAKPKDIKASSLIGLAKALKWTPSQVFLAYQGKDPYKEPADSETEYKEAFKTFAKSIPKQDLLELLAYLATEEDLKEAKKRVK